MNRESISREELADSLFRAHGVGLLEQWIGLQVARQCVEARHLIVTEEDVRRERELTLRKLPPSPTIDGPASGSGVTEVNASERSLEAAMAARNVSAEEFQLVLRRNALLRKAVEADLRISDAELADELERAYGERVEVRHIQLATPAEVDRVLERFVNGEAFESLARTCSANQMSAARGGLLEPFSRHDEDVPDLLRQAAFRLEPGAISPALRVGAWYHILRLERRLPAEPRELKGVRAELERRIRARRIEPEMFSLYEKLFRSATIEIRDPGLRAAFEARHPDRTKDE